jgi:alanyl-tRNA synthetase
MAVTKEDLKRQFAADYRKYYEVPLFAQEGFQRRVCPKCGKGYWSIGREDCGDSSHEPYSFFRKNPRKETYAGFWDKFAAFWKRNGHEIVPRYPVICRWRDDLYFNIASIVDFQRLEAGKMTFEFPANPLVVPQICLRFPDIANIGVTGRHFSSFMMAGQHSFDYPSDTRAYWKDKCIQLNFDYLTQCLEIPKEEIVYGEDLWAMPDLSTLGPCIESFSRGAELVNSVFTEYTFFEDKVVDLPSKVIDVGWGFERLLWFYNGTLTAYDSVFPREIEFMKSKAGLSIDAALFEKYAALSSSLDVETMLNMAAEKERIAQMLGTPASELEKSILPMQGIYAVADHSRTLLFALSDGAIPSNTAGGYNLRVILRRALSFISEYNFGFDLVDVCEMHAEDLKPLFPELSENLDEINEILEVERRKFSDSKAKAWKASQEIVAQGKPITTEKMLSLYESQGITPELLEKAAAERNAQVSIPTDFYKAATSRHQMEPQAARRGLTALDVGLLPATELSFYDHPERDEITAKVVAVDPARGVLVLDRTIIYPEGGGQSADRGTIAAGAVQARVADCQKLLGVVLHMLANRQDAQKFTQGQLVTVRLDRKRRNEISAHHTATHVIIASARKALGRHIWQSGSFKDEKAAHVDMTHYEKPSAEQVALIEKYANEAVRQAIPVTCGFSDRGKAEEEHGFRLYQGGGAIGKTIRVVAAEGLDYEACGGTHLSNTAQLGLVKITKAEQIQDGIVRLHYKAGQRALEYVQGLEHTLLQANKVFSATSMEAIPAAASRLFEDWKARGKALEALIDKYSYSEAVSLMIAAQKKAPIGVEIYRFVEASGLDYDPKVLEKVADAIAGNKGWAAVLSNTDGYLVCAADAESGKNATGLLKERGVGGGTERFARGKLKS